MVDLGKKVNQIVVADLKLLDRTCWGQHTAILSLINQKWKINRLIKTSSGLKSRNESKKNTKGLQCLVYENYFSTVSGCRLLSGLETSNPEKESSIPVVPTLLTTCYSIIITTLHNKHITNMFCRRHMKPATCWIMQRSEGYLPSPGRVSKCTPWTPRVWFQQQWQCGTSHGPQE